MWDCGERLIRIAIRILKQYRSKAMTAEKELQTYLDDGYCLERNVIPREAIAAARARVHELMEDQPDWVDQAWQLLDPAAGFRWMRSAPTRSPWGSSPQPSLNSPRSSLNSTQSSVNSPESSLNTP